MENNEQNYPPVQADETVVAPEETAAPVAEATTTEATTTEVTTTEAPQE